MKCDVDIRKDLYGNIVLGGINTMFNGLKVRFQKEVQKLASNSMVVKVIAESRRDESS